ncbi:MAG: hypothetical protein ABI318_22075 [Chthoniobacteraceae bacterium]
MKPAVLLLALCAGLIAAPDDAPSVSPPAKLIALNGPLTAGVPQFIHCFQGESASVTTTFLLDAGPAPQIVADVFLDGDELGAPLSKAVPFQPAAKSSHPALLGGTFALPLPDAAKAILLRVRLRTAADHGAAAALGEFRLRVTPKTDLKQALTRMTDPKRSGPELRLAVFGPLQGLRELLKEWKTPFDDDGMEMPVRLGADTLAVGEVQDLTHLPQLGSKATLLLIHDDPAAETGLTERTTLDGTLTKLNTPRHEDWRQSPFLHQQLISNITQHLLHHE